MDALAHCNWDSFVEKYVRAGIEREGKLRHPNISLVNAVQSTLHKQRIEQITEN